MKSFAFRLDSILNYRSYLEKKAQRDLFNARNEFIERKKAIKKLADKRMEVARKCSDEGFKGIDIAVYKIYRSFLQKLNDDLEQANINLKNGEEEVKARGDILRKESIKKKTLEALKDLQHRKYIKRLEREDQKIMDELALIRRW